MHTSRFLAPVLRFHLIALTLALWFMKGVGQGQEPILNEIMAVNTTSVPDIVDFEAFPDWIELRNPSDRILNLEGYALSDRLDRPARWLFPAGSKIPAGGHLLIWADGRDAGPGESHTRTSWPWRNFVTEGYHASFSLSGLGETVVLSKLEGAFSRDLVMAGSTLWRYFDGDPAMGDSWKAPGFDDSGWKSGRGQFGYGEGDEATVIDSGPPSPNHRISTYFRTSFVLENPGLLTRLAIRVLVDDGAVVYLNGTEVLRKNMPAGLIGPSTSASSSISGTAESTFSTHSVDASSLVVGTNWLAVEVHQSGGDSSDVSFDLALSASGFERTRLVDSVSYSTQVADVSIGRDPESPGSWVPLQSPTPGTANQGPRITSLRDRSGAVHASHAAGFYNVPLDLKLSASVPGEIRFTTNGSIPTVQSPLYSNPIRIERSTVIKSRLYEPGKVAGPVDTRTIFLGEVPAGIPMISFASDPATLFGDVRGIYYNQHEPPSTSGNFRDVYKDKEVPSTVEYFEPDGRPGFTVKCGASIGAENSWVVAQRPLNIHLRSAFGDDLIHHDLFPGSTIGDHTFITFRNGGDNWGSDMIRDALLPAIAKDRLQIDAQGYRPVLVFINGEYWGIHEMRQKYDKGWFQARHRLLPDQYDHLGYAHVDSLAVTLEEVNGDATRWNQLLTFLAASDLSVGTNWAHVEAEIDLDSFIDFVAVETYVINPSWRHNREFWRSRGTGSRWKWLLPDIDRGFSLNSLSGNGQLDSLLAEDQILRPLSRNAGFRERLGQRIAAHMASTFSPARMTEIINAAEVELTDQVPRHADRWASQGGMTVQRRTDAFKSLRSFVTQRPDSIYRELQNNLGLGAVVTVTVGGFDSIQGSVLVNGVAVAPGSIKLFGGHGVSFVASPSPGHVFEGWSGFQGSSDRLEVVAREGLTIAPRFARAPGTHLGGVVSKVEVLERSGSPYYWSGELLVSTNATLVIEEGVELIASPGAQLRVQGVLNVLGSSNAPVIFRAAGGQRWGGISFESSPGTNRLQHLSIRGATRGFDPASYPAAVSGLDSHLVIEHLDCTESEFPVFTRRGSMVLTHGRLHNPFSGDCINVKGGRAVVSDCVFIGNNAPDTDAIDYDSVVDGVIRNNLIHRFTGPNSDGIDCGERCVNLLVEGNRIYFNSDKGISVGQASSVVLRRNLIVGCVLGAGIKDHGSVLVADQNTFVDNQIAVSVYEKNFADGGGAAVVSNCILSRSAQTPTAVDGYSQLSMTYSISDTIPLQGEGNLFGDPGFISPTILNFQLQPGSRAINSGDPSHSPDPDGSRVDIGSGYVYSAADYPFPLANTVVINELLANSGGVSGDWVELHNRTPEPVDLSDWYLSDDSDEPRKFQIPKGTVISGGGFVVFSEKEHFGAQSTNAGKIIPFALSDVGERVVLSSARGGTLTGYRSVESFGASLENRTLGTFFKPASDDIHFVPLTEPTPGRSNAPPLVGPVVISEIYYSSSTRADAEFVELLNISGQAVKLFAEDKGLGWSFTDGIKFSFPTNAPVTIRPRERIVVARNAVALTNSFKIPPGTQIFEWEEGHLDNAGELLQLAEPGPYDAARVAQFARVDRVVYGNQAPWPVQAHEEGYSLQRIRDGDYGNWHGNWVAAPASPGSAGSDPGSQGFKSWADSFGLKGGEAESNADPDGDGIANLMEYALGSNPGVRDAVQSLRIERDSLGNGLAAVFETTESRSDIRVEFQTSSNPGAGEWRTVNGVVSGKVDGLFQQRVELQIQRGGMSFYRLVVTPSGGP